MNTGYSMVMCICHSKTDNCQEFKAAKRMLKLSVVFTIFLYRVGVIVNVLTKIIGLMFNTKNTKLSKLLRKNTIFLAQRPKLNIGARRMLPKQELAVPRTKRLLLLSKSLKSLKSRKYHDSL